MIELITLIIVVSVSGSLSLLIYSKNPKSATNKSYSLLAASIVFWAIVMYLSIHPPNPSQTLFLIRLSMLAAIVMSYASLILCHTIPSFKFLLKPIPLALITSISLFGAIIAMSPYMFTGLTIENGNIEPISGPGMIMFLISGLGYTLASLIVLARKYRKSSGIVKSQLLYVFIGLSIMFTLLIFANFILVLVFKNSSLINFGPLFTLPFLILTGYAIARKRFLDVSILIMRTISFTILVFVVVILYAIALFALTQLFPQEQQLMISFFLAIILALSFNPIKRSIEAITKNVLFQEAYSSEKLLESVGIITRSTLSINSLTKNILEELHNTVNVSRGFFILNIEDNKFSIRSMGYTQNPKFSSNSIHNLISTANNQVLVFDNLEESAKKDLLRQHQLSIVIPLRVKSHLHGLLVLAEKSSGESYSPKDIEALELMSPQVSVAIQNAISYSEIKSFADTLKDEVNRATRELKSTNRHLKHLDKLKDEFIFIATHELKNPVTAMRGYLSMLNEGLFGKIPTKMQEPVNQLNASNQQLVELVNDLLQIARSEAKTLTIDPETVDLCSAINLIAGNLKALADQKRIKIVHKCLTDKHLQVTADPNRVKEIINNLVGNAIKYSDKGSIDITHEIKDKLVITHVKDQGVGISPANQKKLFTRFFRVDEEAAKGIPGTGLGLYIIKQIIEKMGGEIWFTSSVGKGSTFSFSLPCAPHNESTPTA